jgi:hypothetical protein
MENEEAVRSPDEETIESLVAEFTAYEKAAAKTRIQGFRCVSTAKAKGKNGFKEFCDRAGLDPKSSTTRKYALIGAEADWLLPIADDLPAEWTTIYAVVTLGPIKAKALIDRGVLHSQVTAKELKAATVPEAPDEVMSEADEVDEPASTAEPCIFQVDASVLSDEDRLKLYHGLEKEATKYGLTVTGAPRHLAERLVVDREAA